jgi:integrase
MIIDIDKQKRWFVKYKDDQDHWITKYFGRGWVAQKEAEEFLRAETKEVKEVKSLNYNTSKEKISMLDLIPKLKAELIINGRSERYANDLERIVKRSGLGFKPIVELQLEDFNHYSTMTPITRNRYLSYLKVVLNYAEREEIVIKNPLWKWKKPKEKARKNPLTLEDLERIKEAAAPHLKWAIEVAQNLGVRCGENRVIYFGMDQCKL